MKVLKRTKAFEVRLYMGSRKGYGEEQYASHHVVRAISEFQQTAEHDEPPRPPGSRKAPLGPVGRGFLLDTTVESSKRTTGAPSTTPPLTPAAARHTSSNSA